MYALAIFFQVAYEDLWDEHLLERLNLGKQLTQATPSQYAICTQQLVELLQDGGGKYDYLKSLIESLHAEWMSESSVSKRRRG